MDNKKKQITLMIIAITIFLGIISFATYAFFAGNGDISNVNTNVITGGMYSFIATPGKDINIEVKASDMSQKDMDGLPVKSDNATINVRLTSSSDEETTTCEYDIIWEYQNDPYTEADKTLGTNEYEFSVKIDKDNETVLAEKDLSKFTWNTVENKTRSVIYHGTTTSHSKITATEEEYNIIANVYNIDEEQIKLQGKNFQSKLILTNVNCDVTTGQSQIGGNDDEPEAITHNGVIPEGGVYYSGYTSIYSIPTASTTKPPEPSLIKIPSLYGDENPTPTPDPEPEPLPILIIEYDQFNLHYGWTTMYTAGDEFPEVQDGDRYVYGDYEYRYNYQYEQLASFYNWTFSYIDGWGVHVLDTSKTSYGEIITTINEKDIKSLAYTFSECYSLVNAPVIPSSVTDMTGAFWYDTSLSGTIEVNANPITYDYALFGTEITDITGLRSEQTRTNLLDTR